MTSYHDAGWLVEAFDSTVLRGSVGAGWFDDIAVLRDDLPEVFGMGEFATLVDADRTGRGLVLESVSGQKHVEDIDRRLLRSAHECIGDKALRIVAVMRLNGIVLAFLALGCLG